MEILTGTIPAVKFYLPTEDTNVVSVEYSLNGGEMLPASSVDSSEKTAVATLPYLHSEGRVVIRWTIEIDGTEYSTEDTYDVATPYVHPRDVLEMLGPDGTEQEALDVERVTRYIINAHTHQSFGRYEGTIKVEGNNSSHIALPKRIVSIGRVNGLENLHEVGADGWTISSKYYGVPPLKADDHGWHYTTNGVIAAPKDYDRYRFESNRVFAIDGVWGWEAVPGPIIEAAKLLINDYACSDSVYRDRYLTSMTAADWRIQLNPLAWAKTGNARADALLQDYIVNTGWVVI